MIVDLLGQFALPLGVASTLAGSYVLADTWGISA